MNTGERFLRISTEMVQPRQGLWIGSMSVAKQIQPRQGLRNDYKYRSFTNWGPAPQPLRG